MSRETGSRDEDGAEKDRPADEDDSGTRRRRRRATVIVASAAPVAALALILAWPAIRANDVADAPSSLRPSAPPTSAPTALLRVTPTALPAPVPVAIPTVIPVPTEAAPIGPRSWDVLGGGECVQPFTSPWEELFDVVSCSTPHSAQLVRTGLLSEDIAEPYPGADALSASTTRLCTVRGIVTASALSRYPDLQVHGTFPGSENEWNRGRRSYYCFATRAGGSLLTSSLIAP